MTTANLPVVPSGGENLSTYLQAVNSAPLLTAEDERRLALAYRENEDLDAARELVLSHLRYVVKVARGFMGYGLPLSDLIQEGSIGLMKAVKRFDVSHNVRLASFAIHWIRAEIYNYVLHNWRLVRVATTKAQRKVFFNLRKSRERIGWMKSAEIDRLAEQLDVSPDDVREMEMRLGGSDVPFDGVVEDSDDEQFTPSQYLGDNTYEPSAVVERDMRDQMVSSQLSEALQSLDERSRDIVQRRWLAEDNKPTLNELAEEYQISAERVRQIERRAMDRMKEVIHL